MLTLHSWLDCRLKWGKPLLLSKYGLGVQFWKQKSTQWSKVITKFLFSAVSRGQPTETQSRKALKRLPGFDPITFTSSENSNYWGKSLFEVIRQNIAGWRFFVFKSLLTTPSNVLPLHFKQTFSPIIWIFHWRWWDRIQATF